MLKKTYTEDNDGVQMIMKIYECDICGKNIHESHGCLSSEKNVHICDYCAIAYVENLVSYNYYMIFWLKEMEQKYFAHHRKKRKSLPSKVRKEILLKYKFTCQTCGNKERLEIDHIKPFSKGGTDDYWNLTVLCKTCNIKKGNKIINKNPNGKKQNH